MNIIQKLLSPQSEKLVTVELTRNTFISGVNFAAGETIQVSRRTAAELAAGGSALDLAGDAAQRTEQDRLAALVPGPVEPQPLPDSWSDLPPAFQELWKLDEAANSLIERRSLVWDKLMLTMGRYRSLGDNLQSFKSAYDAANSTLRAKLRKGFADIHVGGQIDGKHLTDVRFLKDAYHRAEQAVRDWTAANRDEWTKQKFLAGQHVQQKHGELCRAIRELHQLGREIFASRVAALGLGDHKVDELFKGSADFVKFRSIEQPTLNDLKLAWYDAAAGSVHFVEKSPSAMVNLLRIWEQTAAEVSKLTAQARKELAAAKKIQAAA